MRLRNEDVVVFRIRPSPSIKGWLVLVHGLALAACFVASAPNAAQLMLATLLGGSFIFNLRRYTGNETFLSYRSKEGWSVLGEDNDHQVIKIREGTVCTTFFIIICFQHPLYKKYLFILRDAMTKESFRRLTVFLKMYGK